MLRTTLFTLSKSFLSIVNQYVMCLLFHVEQLSAQQGQQDIDITGRHSWNARCLPYGLGVDGLQLLARLGGNLMNL